jgi:hypothetical protein
MTIKLDNETAIKCIIHAIACKDFRDTYKCINTILSIISEQGADYILQEIIERLS